jgi:hypothetical protein
MATTFVATCPRCGHEGPAAQFTKRQTFNKRAFNKRGANTMSYSTVQKIGAAYEDFELPELIAKAASAGACTRAELDEYLDERAKAKKHDGESVAQARDRLYIGDHRTGPDDPNGAKIHKVLRQLETAFCGRPDNDPTGRELFKRMIAA